MNYIELEKYINQLLINMDNTDSIESIQLYFKSELIGVTNTLFKLGLKWTKDEYGVHVLKYEAM
jgi:hypothetical protein